ncbi:hypothetical protein DFH08DRAFT_803995 [Mycena albidolilacea]|uniref:Uncharacterized protein n=1 Tax=Mycena albidolilacea TaxID=1033008 RepID=A0AAD7AB36_9AGAR|nr:hypothetical protein DFH08DRAFT_803995 [Mycena albidolilacea]
MKFATIIVLASNYANQIEAAIQKAHTNPSHMLDTLFYCLGGDNSDIQVMQDCGAAASDCHPHKSNTCLQPSRTHSISEKDDDTEESPTGNPKHQQVKLYHVVMAEVGRGAQFSEGQV